MLSNKGKTIVRDISWLSFNGRVLQEANDPSVPLLERIKFLGIFSNNMDEFFRVRVATLKRMIEVAQKGKKMRMHLEDSPERILQEIQMTVLQQQNEFNRIWNIILDDLNKEKIFLLNETQLNKEQQAFVLNYFEEEVRTGVIPMLLESLPDLPYLRDKSIFLGVVMSKRSNAYDKKYALIEVPTRSAPRFVLLPSKPGEHCIILLEDIVRFSLPQIFAYFEYDAFSAHIFKVTKDAEIDIDNDIASSLVQQIEKGLKARRKGKPVRFVYDKEMDPGLLEYLVRRLNLTGRDNLIPGGRIHNFRHFMDFPSSVFQKKERHRPFVHPALQGTSRVTDMVMQRDILLHFPYHSFTSVIDLLREAAMDPAVTQIKITCYRLAPNSKIVNALINAVRNRKQVTVMMEVRARFDEENNLEWKDILEEEGVKVLLGIPNMKVHAKCCVIKKRVNGRLIQYGFVSTGNLNERTARFYGDHCLLTANRNIMADINRIFSYLEHPKLRVAQIRACKTLLVCPFSLRKEVEKAIDREIKSAKAHKKASITIKLNSLSDEILINKLYQAARAGVDIRMIVRGIYCAYSENKKFKKPIRAISIVDEYLEHSRVMVFHNGGKEKVYISSADWMVRNLDHRVEVACPILDDTIRQELKDVLQIQLSDNVKARVLDNELSNAYVHLPGKKVRSQIEIQHYLENKTKPGIETSGDRHRK
jgi:polyphosphate kinase